MLSNYSFENRKVSQFSETRCHHQLVLVTHGSIVGGGKEGTGRGTGRDRGGGARGKSSKGGIDHGTHCEHWELSHSRGTYPEVLCNSLSFSFGSVFVGNAEIPRSKNTVAVRRRCSTAFYVTFSETRS